MAVKRTYKPVTDSEAARHILSVDKRYTDKISSARAEYDSTRNELRLRHKERDAMAELKKTSDSTVVAWTKRNQKSNKSKKP